MFSGEFAKSVRRVQIPSASSLDHRVSWVLLNARSSVRIATSQTENRCFTNRSHLRQISPKRVIGGIAVDRPKHLKWCSKHRAPLAIVGVSLLLPHAPASAQN